MRGVMGEQSVREAAFEVMRHRGMTTIFANPGSTEITFLVDLPDDLRFVIALHRRRWSASPRAGRSAATSRRS